MAFLKLLSSIMFTVILVCAETKEERYEDLVHTSMRSVVDLNEVISSFAVQLAQISTSLFDVKLTLEETENSVRSLEQKILDQEAKWTGSVRSLEQGMVDLNAETLSVVDDEVANLTTLISETNAKIDGMDIGKEGEVMIVSGEQPAGDEKCMKVCAGSTGRSTTDWRNNEGSGIYYDVDISDCGFKTIPTVTTAIEGSSSHWVSLGTSSIYNTSPSAFRIYLLNTYMNPRNGQAEKYKWNVEWIAVGYTC